MNSAPLQKVFMTMQGRRGHSPTPGEWISVLPCSFVLHLYGLTLGIAGNRNKEALLYTVYTDTKCALYSTLCWFQVEKTHSIFYLSSAVHLMAGYARKLSNAGGMKMKPSQKRLGRSSL